MVDGLQGGDCRLFVTARDAEGRSRIGRVVIDLDHPGQPASWGEAPVINVGPPGSFDESGVTGSSVVHAGGRTFQYDTGWTRGVTVPFYFYAGLAISDDGGRTFRRVSPAPILERNRVDPFLTASPWVMLDEGVWRMWYVSGVDWTRTQGGVSHRYDIRYAESRDGIAWHRTGLVCVTFAGPEETSFGRPCVLRDGSRYRMWLSCRGAAYRIGYAESHDGLSWERLDHLAGIDPSPSGWDAEMIDKPMVFSWGGRLAMLYNGNGYGKSGVGLAVESGDAAGASGDR